MAQNNFYFGFATFEEFLAASPTKTIYLTNSVNSEPGVMNTIIRTWQITAAVIVGGVCHYWRKKVGSDCIYGAPFPEDVKYADAAEARAVSLQYELSAIARDYDFSVVHALLSLPKNVVVMTGKVTSLEYDPETNSFKRKLNSDQQPEKLAA